MPDGEHIELPSGISLWYYDEDHSYWAHNPKTGKRGKRLAGVTTAVKTLDHNNRNLLKWAAETQCRGIAMLYLRDQAEYLHWLTSPDLMWQRLSEEGLTYDQVREAAGEKGTNVHRLAFEALAEGKPGLDFDTFSEAERGQAGAVSAFWFDHEPIASQVEQVVYSERLGIAGRLDFAGELGRKCGNPTCACQDADGVGVVDLKTGGFISAAAHAQVGGGYPMLREESGFGTSNWAAILQVFDDGHYEFFKAESDPERFENAVKTYRDANTTSAEATRAYKARKTYRETEQQLATFATNGNVKETV